jgi:hypothetical protein
MGRAVVSVTALQTTPKFAFYTFLDRENGCSTNDRPQATTLAQWRHFVAASGKSVLRHSGHVFVGGGGDCVAKTLMPRFDI